MSHHCHDEHVAHGGHDHGHGHDHDHDHDHTDDVTPALQHSLYDYIDFDRIVALNETPAGAARAVLAKTWAERLAPTPELASDADEQLLVAVPFTGQVKLHAILLRTSAAASAPRTLHVFANQEDLDFGAAEAAVEAGGRHGPTQTLELAQTSEVQELPVRRAAFAQVRRLTLFFADNFGAGEEEETRLSYVGFRGTWMALGRAPVNILYEAAANPADHAVKGTAEKRMGSDVGGRK